MNDVRPRILVITPVSHIQGVMESLKRAGDVRYMPDPSPDEVIECVAEYDAIFTNPNKSNVFLGERIVDAAVALRVICTASTGTNHIDKSYAKDRGIAILALTEEREVIDRISSTAELAFAIMLCALRNVPQSIDAVKRGEWNYEKYIGRQMDYLTVGVVGFGRLGTLFAAYAKAFGSDVLVYDPYKDVTDERYEQVDLDRLLSESDVISIHVHVTNETVGMIDESWLSRMKDDVVLVNSARGDVCNEDDIIDFLRKNPKARYATDVLSNEVTKKTESRLRDFAWTTDQVLITPHIGGMTREGQMIAYNHAASMLLRFLAP